MERLIRYQLCLLLIYTLLSCNERSNKPEELKDNIEYILPCTSNKFVQTELCKFMESDVNIQKNIENFLRHLEKSIEKDQIQLIKIQFDSMSIVFDDVQINFYCKEGVKQRIKITWPLCNELNRPDPDYYKRRAEIVSPDYIDIDIKVRLEDSLTNLIRKIRIEIKEMRGTDYPLSPIPYQRPSRTDLWMIYDRQGMKWGHRFEPLNHSQEEMNYLVKKLELYLLGSPLTKGLAPEAIFVPIRMSRKEQLMDKEMDAKFMEYIEKSARENE